MTTVSDLMDQVSSLLHSYTGILEQATYLTTALGTADTTVAVAHPKYITRGLIEVDDELMHVATTGELSVDLMPFGRGAQGATAAAHAVNAKVTNDPLIPRKRIFEALRQTVRQVQTDLYRVRTETFISSTAQATYALAADVDRILSLRFQTIGPSLVWEPIKRWSLDKQSTTANGRAVTLSLWMPPSRTVQVVYASPLPAPTATTDDLETIGIAAELHDVLLYGTCWRITQFLESQRLQQRSVEQQMRAQGVDPGSASKVAQQFFGMFSERRREERKRLLDAYPPTAHYTTR